MSLFFLNEYIYILFMHILQILQTRIKNLQLLTCWATWGVSEFADKFKLCPDVRRLMGQSIDRMMPRALD